MHFLKSELKNSIALLLLILITIALPAQQLRLNEFMSSNSTTIHDEDWDYEDWIELYYFGDQPLNLSGIGLSDDYDDPFKWVFPDTILQPGQFLLIWASGKNRVTPGEPLHTNFSIKSEGEELLLTSASGVLLDELAPVAVPTDISFGRFPDGAGDWLFFDEPTPGTGNSTAGYSGVAQTPVFSHEGGLYTTAFMLTLEAEPGATIYYTTNGNVPNPTNGVLYAQPFNVSQTQIIRARAFVDGFIPSEPKTMTYSRIDETLQGFNSNLPLIIIHQFNTPITPGDRTPAMAVFVDHNQGDSAYLPGEIALQSRIAANIRGFSSQSFPKKMFGFHMLDENDGNRNESLFGMPSEHNWILNAPYSDKTLMRNVIAYTTGQGFGRWAPRTQFVELFLHSGNGPVTNAHYHGVYVLVERIKWDDNRVNITKITPGNNSEPEISGGYIFKRDRLNTGEVGMTTNMGTLLAHVRPREDEMTTEQKAWLINYLNDFEAALFGPNFTHPETGYEAYIDTDSFIDHMLITELFKEIDGYRLSTYIYKDRNGKLVMGPVWDFNLSLGNANYYQGWTTTGWYYPQVSWEAITYWYTRLLQDPEFVNRMQYRWWQLRQNLFSDEHLTDFIYSNKDLLAEAQVRNFQRWPVLGQYVWPNWYIGQTYEDEVNWMHNWLMERVAWIDTQMGDPPVFPDYTLIYYWLFDVTTPNDTPLEVIDMHYGFNNGGLLDYMSALAGYPFNPDHPNWRKASMERRNAPTSINYRLEGNDSISYEEANMRGIQIKQPFTGDGGENTLVFHLPTNGFEEVVFRFAAMDEEAATHLKVDYSVAQQDTVWTAAGLENPTRPLTGSYQLFEYDFKDIGDADDNPDFKIRIRFLGDDMTIDEGNRVSFNNFSLDGVQTHPGNLPPYLSQQMPHRQLIEGDESISIDLNNYFSDPDNDELTFFAESSRPGHVSVALNGSALTLFPDLRGGAVISVTASDGIYTPVVTTFEVVVYPAPLALKEAEFSFSEWMPDEPEFSYPPNMLFLQSNTDDPSLTDTLMFAYFIPHYDYHPDDSATIGFPYNNTRRTRINGLGSDGISFVNTGRGRDLGGALLALDTRLVADAIFDWTAATIEQNERQYAIRLQYRTDINVPFADLTENGLPIEYVVSTNGDIQLFEIIHLPADALNVQYVQLLWRYYHISGETGARPELRLDDILIKNITGIAQHPDNLMQTLVNGNSILIQFQKPLSGLVALYDISGKLVAESKIGNSLQTKFHVSTGKGIYILRITTPDRQFSRKLFIH